MVLDLHTEGTQSLKAKRRVISSMKEKIRNRFNVSVIESGYQDLWQKTQVAISMVSDSKAMLEKAFEQIEDLILNNYPVRLIAADRDYVIPGG